MLILHSNNGIGKITNALVSCKLANYLISHTSCCDTCTKYHIYNISY